MSEDFSKDVLLQGDMQPAVQIHKVENPALPIHPKSIVFENPPVQPHEDMSGTTAARQRSQDKLQTNLKRSCFTHSLTSQSSGIAPPSVVETLDSLPAWKQKMLFRLRRASTPCLLASRRRASVTAAARRCRSSHSYRYSTGVQRVERSKYTPEQLREKFRYAICMVRFAVRLALALREYSRTSCEVGSTLEELNYHCKESEFSSQTQKLVFSRATFAASNVVYVPPWARKLLALPPDKRSPHDIQHLASMVRTMHFFRNSFPQSNILDLCTHCWYARYEKQRVILSRGHRADHCYLLFSGSVFVNIREEGSSSGQCYHRTADVLSRGALFGETAVLLNTRRTATLISRESVECLVVDAETCRRIFPGAIEREDVARLECLKNSSIFSDWPEASLQKLSTSCKLIECPYGSVIDRNTAESDFVYMVTKGRVELMCTIPLPLDPLRHSLLHVPPDHTYLPPPPSSSQLSAARGEKVVISVDSLTPPAISDLVSLQKATCPLPLILVSRGSEVIRIPKPHLQTTPPLHCWKSLLDKARKTPRYPSTSALSHLFLEHVRWSAYKSLVLRNSLDGGTEGCPIAVKPQSAKTVQMRSPSPSLRYPSPSLRCPTPSLRCPTPLALQRPRSSPLMTAEVTSCYEKCLSCKAPLFDIKLHLHAGPCLRSWSRPGAPEPTLPNRRTRRALSTPCT